MKPYPYLTVILFMVTVPGCALFQAKETSFLYSGQGHATEEEVQQRLGPPKLANTIPSGQSVWVYQVYDWQPRDNRVTAPGTWCDEYILTFDHERVLCHWTHNTYFHGGEAFPTYCVPDRFYLVS